MTFGILGYGRFGKFLSEVFCSHFESTQVRIYSRSHEIDNKKFFSFEDVCKSHIIIPCIPISHFYETIQKIKTLVTPQQTIIDICSVKMYPVKWMKEVFSEKQPLIASHPMFGPDGTQNGHSFKGLKLMIHNISASKKIYELYVNFWKKLGVEIFEMTPEEHDKYAAYSMNFNHFFGQIGKKMNLKPTPIDTKGFSVICDALNYTVKDTNELFYDMQIFNPYSSQMREKVLESIHQIEKEIEKEKKIRVC